MTVHDQLAQLGEIVLVARQAARMEALMDAEKVVRDRIDLLPAYRQSKAVLMLAADDIAQLNALPERRNS